MYCLNANVNLMVQNVIQIKNGVKNCIHVSVQKSSETSCVSKRLCLESQYL